MSWRFVVALLFAVLVSLFAIQNADIVSVNFVTWELQISQALVILLSAMVGAIMVMLFDVIRWIKTQTKLNSQNKVIQRLEKENADLQMKLTEAKAQIDAIPIHEQAAIDVPVNSENQL